MIQLYPYPVARRMWISSVFVMYYPVILSTISEYQVPCSTVTVEVMVVVRE